MTFENLKKYCEREYEKLSLGGNLEECIDKYFDAIIFFTSFCTNKEEQETMAWWDNTMLPKLKAFRVYFKV